MKSKKSSTNSGMNDRYFTCVLEDLRSQLSIFGEVLAIVKEKMDRIENDICVIKNNIKVKVDLEEFKMLENRLVAMEKRLAASGC